MNPNQIITDDQLASVRKMDLYIPAIMDEHKARKIKVYPTYTNRASMIGEECERRLVYHRTHWQDQRTHTLELQYIFDEGNIQESATTRELLDAGIEIVESQRPFSIPELQITGSIDGKVIYKGDWGVKKIPLELKSMSPMIWTKMSEFHVKTSLEQFPWTKKYIAQLLLYCHMDQSDVGILLLKNKSNGQIKQMVLWVADYKEELAEILAKAARINAHVEAKTLPDQIDDSKHCQGCPFEHICQPNLEFDGLEIVNDEELEAMLDTRESLEHAYKQYNELNDQIKEAIKGKKMLVGNWVISGKEILVKYAPKAASESVQWRSSIKKAVQENTRGSDAHQEYQTMKFMSDIKNGGNDND